MIPESFIVKISQRFQSGFPDCVCIHEGKVSFIEFKAGYRKMTPLQADVFRRIRMSGGNVFQVRQKVSGEYELYFSVGIGMATLKFEKVETVIKFITGGTKHDDSGISFNSDSGNI